LVEQVLAVIRSLTRAGTTLVIVTHVIPFARDVAATVVFMDRGLLVEQGPPWPVPVHPPHQRPLSVLRWVRPAADAPRPAPPARCPAAASPPPVCCCPPLCSPPAPTPRPPPPATPVPRRPTAAATAVPGSTPPARRSSSAARPTSRSPLCCRPRSPSPACCG